jgi:ABC-type polysaccharide/polyol phosphate export permease
MMLCFLPVYMFFMGLFAVGVGWIVSSLHVYLRDTAQVLSVVLTLWFWMTPIFIPEIQYPRWAKILLKLNPLALMVRAYRERLLSSRWPNTADILVLAAWSIAVFVAGGLFFRHLKRGFADVL